MPPPETDEQRRERHFRHLRQLTDRTVRLAMLAADRAEAELTDTPDPAGGDAPAPRRSNAKPKPSAAVQDFERLARLARQLIALESRLSAPPRPAKQPAAPKTAAEQAPAAPPAPEDPRRLPVRQHLHKATAAHPDRARLRRAIDDAIDEALRDDPAVERVAAEVIARVCHQLGLPFDIRKLPDSLVYHPGQIPPPPDWARPHGTPSRNPPEDR